MDINKNQKSKQTHIQKSKNKRITRKSGSGNPRNEGGGTFLGQQYPKSGPWWFSGRSKASWSETQPRWWLWTPNWTRYEQTEPRAETCPPPSLRSTPPWIRSRSSDWNYFANSTWLSPNSHTKTGHDWRPIYQYQYRTTIISYIICIEFSENSQAFQSPAFDFVICE